MMRRYASFVVALVLLGLPIVTATAQAPRRSSQPMQDAIRAIHEGRFDEVALITEKLDAQDPDVVAVRARALIARGRYGDAESLLRPIVSRAGTSEAALELGLLQQMLGRTEAGSILERVATLVGSSADPVAIARGARALSALGRRRDANDAYRVAAARAPNDPAINTGWGELFLETYNKSEALKSFSSVLEADRRWTPALMGVARALADDDPPQAVAAAKKVLEINPASVDAQVFLAQQAADSDHYPEARQLLQKALTVNPSSIEVHAQLAAIAYVEDKQQEFEAEVSKALAIAPSRGEVFRAAGERAARSYRFDEAVALTRRGLALDPNDPRALADLGIQLLRTGDEPAARTALEGSFKTDPFSVETFNLLAMMDKLDKFETFRDGDLIFRVSKEEAPVLREYMVPLAHQALNTFSASYEFVPKGPILIEVFSKHDDFAVRTIGLPGMIGALGACFGRVVTLDSPKAQPPGTFLWEATLWHELAHVITLQMTNQRIPRWLTEGISEFEEKRAHPEWARPGDLEFAGLLDRGEAIKLKDLNSAFQNPRTISIAYYEAAQLVEHLVNLYGDAGLRKVLRAYGQGLDTNAALKAALDTDLDRLQVSFSQELDRRYASLRRAAAAGPKDEELPGMTVDQLKTYAAEHPNSYTAQMSLGRGLRRAEQFDEAVKAFERAAELVPNAPGANSPHGHLAGIALQRNDRTRAITELQALMAIDAENVAAARQLAVLFKQAGIDDPAKTRPVYARIVAIDPFDMDAHSALGRLAMQANEGDTAAREFRAVIALGPVDRAAAHTDLAESLLKAGKRAESKKETLAALEIAPSYERAQALLLKLVDAQPGRP
jgi:tetratricopeptide (TPR) repeat protein